MAEFSWAAAGDVGLGLLGGLSTGLNAYSKNAAAEAAAESANKIRDAQNMVERSKRSLAATVRDINNDRLIEAGAKQLDTLTTNAIRMQDSMTNGNFEQSIKDAERLGAVSAQAAASGLGGTSIAAISSTAASQVARAGQSRAERQGDATYDASQATVDVLANALKQTSTGPLTANIQYGRNVATPGGDGIAGALLRGLIDKKASLVTLLGSLEDSPASTPTVKPTMDVAASNGVDFQFEEATSSPVSQSFVNGTDLGQLSGDYVDRSDRLLLNATLK